MADKTNQNFTPDGGIAADVEAVMKKYDRESNTRIWEGKPKLMVDVVLAAFALYAMYCSLFAVMLDEVRLTSFVGCLLIMGYLIYPSRKKIQRENFIPSTLGAVSVNFSPSPTVLSAFSDGKVLV